MGNASENGSGLKFENYFTLSVSVSQRTVGEIEGGYRVDFDYASPTGGPAITGVQAGVPVLTKTPKPMNIDGAPIARKSAGQDLQDALIASGSDWVFVSDEGFVDLDSKITLTLQNLSTACLLGLQLVGRADLRDSKDKHDNPIFKGDETAEQVVTTWRQGFGEGSYIPLILGVTIDVPVSGTNKKQTAIYEECHALGHSILVGAGKAIFDKNSQIANVSLVVGKAAAR